MATAEQLKTLIRSHLDDNFEQFITTVLQVAAHEARKGHRELAQELQALVDDAKRRRPTVVKFPDPMDDLIQSVRVDVPMQALVLDSRNHERIRRIIVEYRRRNELKSYGLSHRRKILLSGPPGTGKTMTAKVLATQLGQALHIVQLDRLITKYMGESSAKLRQVFDRIQRIPGVYLFDEFDAIGGDREFSNDVGEMRRVLTSLLQFIENDTSDNLVLAATNSSQLLDRALFRRFDDVLVYSLPDSQQRRELVTNVLGVFIGSSVCIERVVSATNGLSHAEITRAAQDAMKTAILRNQEYVTTHDLLRHVKERREIYNSREE